MAILRLLEGTSFFSVPDEDLDRYTIPIEKLEEMLKRTRIKLGASATPDEISSAGRIITGDQRSADDPRASAVFLYWTTVVCPNCYTPRRVMVNSEDFNIYECGNCRHHYRA